MFSPHFFLKYSSQRFFREIRFGVHSLFFSRGPQVEKMVPVHPAFLKGSYWFYDIFLRLQISGTFLVKVRFEVKGLLRSESCLRSRLFHIWRKHQTDSIQSTIKTTFVFLSTLNTLKLFCFVE